MGVYERVLICVLFLLLVPLVHAENATINTTNTVSTCVPERSDVSASLLQEVTMERELLQQRNEMYNATLNTLMFFAACFAIIITILGIIVALIVGMGMIRNNRDIQDLRKEVREDVNTHFERNVQKTINQIAATMKEQYVVSVKEQMADVDERIEQLQKELGALRPHHDRQRPEPPITTAAVSSPERVVEKKRKNVFDDIAPPEVDTNIPDTHEKKSAKRRGKQ